MPHAKQLDLKSIRGPVYVSSDERYALGWAALKSRGLDINATWVARCQRGVLCWDLLEWSHRAADIARARCVLALLKKGDKCTAESVEISMALAEGKRVFAVGMHAKDFNNDPLFSEHGTLTSALLAMQSAMSSAHAQDAGSSVSK